jgi:hypothetical protein
MPDPEKWADAAIKLLSYSSDKLPISVGTAIMIVGGTILSVWAFDRIMRAVHGRGK